MPTIPEKSIAVLPFENLSAKQENAYFADGVQDEILTDLAKVADLKVISRTSALNYRQTTGRTWARSDRSSEWQCAGRKRAARRKSGASERATG